MHIVCNTRSQESAKFGALVTLEHDPAVGGNMCDNTWSAQHGFQEHEAPATPYYQDSNRVEPSLWGPCKRLCADDVLHAIALWAAAPAFSEVCRQLAEQYCPHTLCAYIVVCVQARPYMYL